MANTIKIKRSAVSGKVPVVGDLQLGELAVNTFDGKLYTKKDNGTASIVEIGGSSAGVTSFSAGTTGLTPSTATTGAVTLAGTLAVANGGTGVTTSTGSGSTVLSTSPTLVTPLLGTPTSGTLTNCTGYTFANIASKPTTLSGYGITDAPTTTGTGASGTWGISITGSAAQLNGISSIGLFNNMGQTHGTRTSFDASTPSYDFGFRYVQGSTNGPSTGGSQFYSLYMGLGSEYPATGGGSYGMFMAIDRNVANPYLSVRYNESNSLSTWRKISAGTADTLTTARTINGTSFNGSANITITANTTNLVTFNNGGAGGASGSTFNGSAALTVSYNTVGAPSTTGTNASGSWGISITGSSASCTGNAATATTATNQSGGTVSATTGAFSGDITMSGTGAIKVANGTTAQRPTGANGLIRYNTSVGAIEAYVQGAWQTIANTSVDYGLITTAADTTFDYGSLV